MLPALGNGHLEYEYAPRIARDPSTGVLLVTWDTFNAGVGGHGARAWRSTNNGVNWNLVLSTSDDTAHTTVAFSPDGFELGLTYIDVFTPSNNGAQVSWRSPAASDGSSWDSGYFISSFRSFTPINIGSRPCFWGDYDGLSYNPPSFAFMHSWYDSTQGPRSVIRGRFADF